MKGHKSSAIYFCTKFISASFEFFIDRNNAALLYGGCIEFFTKL